MILCTVECVSAMTMAMAGHSSIPGSLTPLSFAHIICVCEILNLKSEKKGEGEPGNEANDPTPD